ncbi:MAG: hypothetical protein Q7S33_04755 [Nanoarchaeota archaeon]|nr:hypothetical protein [Nanoarchaeota archaeon]
MADDEDFDDEDENLDVKISENTENPEGGFFEDKFGFSEEFPKVDLGELFSTPTGFSNNFQQPVFTEDLESTIRNTQTPEEKRKQEKEEHNFYESKEQDIEREKRGQRDIMQIDQEVFRRNVQPLIDIGRKEDLRTIGMQRMHNPNESEDDVQKYKVNQLKEPDSRPSQQKLDLRKYRP